MGYRSTFVYNCIGYMKSGSATKEELLEQLRQIRIGLTATQDALENDKNIAGAHRTIAELGGDLDKAEGLLAQWEISKNPKTRKLWHRVKKLSRFRTAD